MRCEFVEIPCAVKNTFVCLECKNCKKRVNIAETMRDKFQDMVTHFPACAAPPPAPPPQAAPPPTPERWDPAGAGTQLKKLLSKLGIKSTENCSCNARARIMNERGIEWCEQNVNEIVGWLKEEAGRRRLPFLAFPTKIIVERAIKAAKRVRDKSAAPPADAAVT